MNFTTTATVIGHNIYVNQVLMGRRVSRKPKRIDGDCSDDGEKLMTNINRILCGKVVDGKPKRAFDDM